MIIKPTWENTWKIFTFQELSPTSANIAVKYLQRETSWTCTFQRPTVEIYSSWTLLVAGDDKQLYDYIVSHLEAGQKAFKCTICGKVSAHKTNLRKHVENMHFPGLFTYTCKYCPETFPTKNLLNHHVTNSHRANVVFWVGFSEWIKILNCAFESRIDRSKSTESWCLMLSNMMDASFRVKQSSFNDW